MTGTAMDGVARKIELEESHDRQLCVTNGDKCRIPFVHETLPPNGGFAPKFRKIEQTLLWQEVHTMLQKSLV